MPGLTPRDMNGYGGYDRGMANGYDPYGEREEYSREEDIYRKVVRNGRGTNDRFQNEYYPDQGSMADFNTNEPTYELDHLASFDAGRGNSSMSAEDGLQKLKQMENSPGIWTMRCIMIIERRFVVVLDKSTGEELERFPVQLINEPTAIMKTDRREIYHNLVLFTVLEDPKRRNGSIDMHIFHSIKNPAREIVDEMLAAKSGQTRISSGPRSTNIHPADLPGPSRDSMFLRMTEYPESRHVGGQGRLARPPFLREDYEAGQNEVLEKDVQLLNHCFDDIEKFVARLQQAAESYKELEKRKKERGNKSKKKQAGDGMLSLRARPPPSSDFVDIFQKFKLSFNLLAKLKSHIHNPNAIELVHFLFTPLSLIVEASRDPVHGNQNLAERAISPAISHDAKHLLVNCLTSKETEFWESLGRNWTTSKEEYKGFIPPYAPRFYDGWQPALSVVEDNPQVPLEYAVQAHADQIYNRAREQEARHRAAQMVMPFPAEEDRRYGRVDEYRRDYESRPSPRAPTPPPGHGMKNPAVGGYQEYVEKHIESSHYDRNFVANESSSRRLPERPMAPSPRQQPQEDDNVVYAREIRRTGGRVCEVMHDRVGKNEKELTVNKGEVLRVVDSSRKWWKVRNAKGEIGYAPYTILQEKDEGPEERDTGTPQDRMSGAYNSYIPNEQALAPPAPPPAPAVDSGMGRRAKRGEFKYF